MPCSSVLNSFLSLSFFCLQTEENLGMAMIYTIAEELKEWLLANNSPAQVSTLVMGLIEFVFLDSSSSCTFA